MKKNIRYNLLKSLFLTGTVLTISACNKGDKNNANTELQNEIQSLKQQLSEKGKETKQITKEKEVIEQELKQYEEKIKNTKENDKELLKSIQDEIDKLKTVDNTIDFSKGLDSIKSSLCKISSENAKDEVTEYFKEKIKFDFVKNEQDSDLINFKCGNLCIESINDNFYSFNTYVTLAGNVLNILGCEDDYKIDLSKYNGFFSLDCITSFGFLPKTYFKTLYFNVDNSGDVFSDCDKLNNLGSLNTDKGFSFFNNLIYFYYIYSDLYLIKCDFKNISLGNIELDGDNDFCVNFKFYNKFETLFTYFEDCVLSKFLSVFDPFSLNFGKDGKCLNLGEINLLNFDFNGKVSNKNDVVNILSRLFKIFNVDCNVSVNVDNNIELSKDGETYSYKLENGYLKKV